MSVSVIEDFERKKELLKRTICKGSTDDEFELFLHICKRTGLDPFSKQIYPIFRPEKQDNGSYRDKMTVQTGIDGLRMIAEKTGNYSPGKESTYSFDQNGRLESATSYIKKRTPDGSWHEVSSTAFYDEFVQTFKNKGSGENEPSKFWKKMPRQMLSKCAESHALRKAFPAELSGVYTNEEMGQAQNDTVTPPSIEKKVTGRADISEDEWSDLEYLVMELNDRDYESQIASHIGVEKLQDIVPRDYDRVVRAINNRIKKREEKNGSSEVARMEA